jgi:hypothetical protein
MSERGDEPRIAGSESIHDDALNRLPTESPGLRWVLRPFIQGMDSTCHTGWTFICETHPPGTTCLTGLTLKCDTHTCTWGVTLICDRRPVMR